ncbi:MAG: outer membrane beta-barrel protein [Bacteroidota bacterium]
MTTRTFILFLLTLFIGSIQAQTGNIQGQVATAEMPLGFANVLLNNVSDSSLVKAEASNENGQFTFSNVAFGTYFIRISFLGYEEFESEVIELNQSLIELNNITLSEANNALNEVTVTAQKPLVEVLADKTIFNVQNTLSATGTNGLELLRKAPGVILDNSNNIILEGKTGVQIFINNKPSPLNGEDLSNYLQSLQADQIEAIEIITQPSSKYDAAGNAGIINIRLKKDKRFGTNGSVTLGGSYGQNGQYNASTNFNNRTAKGNLFGSFSQNEGETWSFIYLDRLQNGVRYDSETETLRNRNAQNVKVGYDFFANDRHTFGILLNGNFFDNQNVGLTTTPIIPQTTQSTSQILIANNESQNNNYNLSGNLNYRFADTSGHELLVDVDYGRFNRERVSFQPNRYVDAQTDALLFERNFEMNTPIDINIFTAKADYTQNLLGGKLGMGLKYSQVVTNNTFQFFDVGDGESVLNQDRSNIFDYTEIINAAYLNFNKKWSKWNLQVGLRAEQTISEGILTSTQENANNAVNRNYINLFPSGGLTFVPNRKSSWSLTYSRRIQRPNYQSLNPFEYQLDELSFSRGNPFLQPQYTDNFKLSHTYNYRLTTSLSYTYIQDFFAQVTDTLGATRNFLMTRNIANQRVWNVGVSYPFDVAKWWSVYASVNAFHAAYEAQDEKFNAIDQSTLSFYAQNTFVLPAGFKLEVSGWFSSPSVWGGTYETQSLGSLDLAVQKKLWNDQLAVRLAFGDILYTSPWRGQMQFGELFIDGTGGWESRRMRLNLTYTFGNSEVKRARRRSTGLEDESKRVGG